MEPLLLLHGALGAKDQFKPLLPLLPGDVPVHSFNLAGHGGVPFAGDRYRIESFAEQLLDWLTTQKLTRVNVFGYSMGGYVALEAARLQPDRFSKIFTLATKFAWSPESADMEVKKLRPEIILEKVPAFAQALQERHAPLNWEDVMRRTTEMMLHLGKEPLLSQEQLQQIAVPVRIAVGDRDAMVTIEESLAAFRQLVQGQFQVLPSTKHPLEQLDWQLLAQALVQYFQYASV